VGPPKGGTGTRDTGTEVAGVVDRR